MLISLTATGDQDIQNYSKEFEEDKIEPPNEAKQISTSYSSAFKIKKDVDQRSQTTNIVTPQDLLSKTKENEVKSDKSEGIDTTSNEDTKNAQETAVQNIKTQNITPSKSYGFSFSYDQENCLIHFDVEIIDEEIELIFQLIIYQVSQYSDCKYISICLCKESIKEKVSINQKIPDINKIKYNVKELSIINKDESINIEKLVTFTTYLLKCIDNNFKIPELILNGFLEDSLSHIISKIDREVFQSLSFLRIEGNNKLILTPAILSSINNFSSLKALSLYNCRLTSLAETTIKTIEDEGKLMILR